MIVLMLSGTILQMPLGGITLIIIPLFGVSILLILYGIYKLTEFIDKKMKEHEKEETSKK
jgi:hypothetical protein